MLKLSIYTENRYQNKQVICIGEDALPFINEAGMFVADGLGGTAGIPITEGYKVPDLQFIQEILELDKLLELKEYAYYISELFGSLRQCKGCSIKSGYIGSHVMGVLLAYHLMKLKVTSFSNYDDWNSYVRNVCDSLYLQYKTFIECMHVQYERSKMGKLMYCGTTLSTVFFRENEKSIDAIFVNCGDSRHYVCDVHGFRQAVDDQKVNDRITQLYSINTDPPMLLYASRTYQKPCIFFTMTDGVYSVFRGRNGFYSSPLLMEITFFSYIVAADSIECIERNLREFLQLYAREDDSASMTIAFFGFETYDDLKEYSRKYLEKLYNEYELYNVPKDFFISDYKERICGLNREKYLSVFDKQCRIFNSYLINHLANVSTDKLNDVLKNGWI